MVIFNEHTTWMDVMRFAGSRAERGWTYIIMGKNGPTGKTFLCNMLKLNNFNAIELSEDVIDLVNYNDNKNHYKVDYARKLLLIVLNKPLSSDIYSGKNPGDFTFDDWREVMQHETRAEAEKILNTMIWVAETYGYVSRGDYMELINLSPKRDDCRYGWIGESIKKARIIPGPFGWFIEFPRDVELCFLTKED